MQMNIYAVYDKAVSAYMRPFVMQTDGQAMRMFGDEATNAESAISKHPEDYALFRLASFEDSSGEITPQEPRCLARAHELASRSRLKDFDAQGLPVSPNGLDDGVNDNA